MDELWKIRGSNPVLFTVPFRAKWHENEAEISCAIPLLPKQQRAVSELLQAVARPLNGMWAIPRTELERIGELMPEGTDPEDCFCWERPRKASLVVFESELRADRDAFLDKVYQSIIGPSRDDVECWWNVFCRQALDWLVNEERPLDMYFIRLHPSPYRPDWMYKVREVSRKGRALKKFDPRPLKLLHNGEFLDRLRKTNLLSFDGDRQICERRIEVQYTARWWQTIRYVEQERLKTFGPCGYLERVMQSVARRIPASIVIYSQYIFGSRVPTARARPGQMAGMFHFVARRKPKRDAQGAPPNLGDSGE